MSNSPPRDCVKASDREVSRFGRCAGSALVGQFAEQFTHFVVDRHFDGSGRRGILWHFCIESHLELLQQRIVQGGRWRMAAGRMIVERSASLRDLG